MLIRKAESEIKSWISGSNKSLLVYGVRQAGKTFSIRKSLKESGCDFIEFNLIEKPVIVELIENSSSADDLILKLSLFSDKKLIPGKTFIFFDEIQKCREIVTKIKFLTEDRRFRFIMSGSLLGVEIVNLKSAPVGYLQSLKMNPLDFEEFLQVFNIDKALIDKIRDSFSSKTPVEDVIHRRLMEIFNLYLIIGGMPAAVEKYRLSGNIDEVISEHRSIIEQYRLDFTKYETESRKLILSRIYDLIPAELNNENKRFKVADITKDLRYDKIEDSFIWLWKAGVALGVFNVTEPRISLLLNEKRNLFKLFLSDIGLLTTILGKPCKLKILTADTDLNKGMVYENFVAQELSTHGYPLYYYNSKKIGELDFVIEHNGRVLPIEVKSGKDYYKHSALCNLLSDPAYGIPEAVILTNENLSMKGKTLYLPIYMAMFLTEEPESFIDISPERFTFNNVQ